MERINRCAIALCVVMMMWSCEGAGDSPVGSGVTEEKAGGESGALYFDTVEQAVEVATPLLEKKEWGTLARYYDLSDSPVERAELENGTFFYSARVEGFQHPAGFDRYKQPFAPGFKFMRSDETGQKDVVKVTVLVEIDQGGGMTQRGMSEFYMRKHAKGWQFLPGGVDSQ